MFLALTSELPAPKFSWHSPKSPTNVVRLLAIIHEVFRVIGINANVLGEGGGNILYMTQQVPQV